MRELRDGLSRHLARARVSAWSRLGLTSADATQRFDQAESRPPRG
ncbi:hypothetical protein CZ774_07060 [Frigoribacterium sp. JB110]|nr:hypothetical protein CZ774_07060 [Frigoribacterium sp. JB110]